MYVKKIITITTLLLLAAEACEKDFDCSFNGDCVNGSCKCHTGWMGQYCHALRLGKVRNGTGLNQLQSRNTSTWGGSILKADDGMYHMWASEISRHCGIHRWVTNSIVVHAVSKGPPDWVFERKEEVFPLFSHEPIVDRAPTGEYVLYLTHFDGDASDSPTCNCTDGCSNSGEPGCAGEAGGAKDKDWAYSYMAYASDPNGPWSDLQSLARVSPHTRSDLNLAPAIRSNGSAEFWTRWDIWQATDWRNASTYFDQGQAPDWNHGGVWEGEDPSMWIDKNGRYHIISHNGPRGEFGPQGDCGRHLFSESGAAGTWNVAPLPKEEKGGCAYPRVVPFERPAVNRTFYRRERPHLVFDGHTPVALSTAVLDSPTGEERDASYTLVQPVLP